MRLVILTIGSLGDLQPNIALGLGLKAAGHEVCLVTHHVYEELVRERGLEFRGIAGSPQDIIAQAGQVLLESGLNFFRFMQAFKHVVEPVAWQGLDDMEKACREAELILYSAFTIPGHFLAQQLGIPAMVTLLQPLSRTRARPSMLLPFQRSLGKPLNWLTHLTFEQLFWHPLRPMLNRWRKQKGLDPAPFFGHFGQIYGQEIPQLCGISPAVYSRPADWGDNVHLTGYWFLDALPAWHPPPDLLEFLAQGPKPISVGFGSMQSQDLEQRLQILLEALSRTGKRAILLKGWSGLTLNNLPEGVYQAENLPHDWLFPRVSATVHHGGAGTTAAALRAGLPSIVMPFFFDQIFWGKRLASLGAAPAPIGRRDVSVPALVTAIEHVSNDHQMRERVKDLGRTIRSENGVGRAVQAVEAYLQANQESG